MSTWQEKFCERLQASQIESGLNDKEIGEKIGKSGQTISNWKKGKDCPKLMNLDAFAKVVGKPMHYFFPELDEEVEPEPMTLSVTERGLVEEFRRLAPDLQRILLETLAAFTKASNR